MKIKDHINERTKIVLYCHNRIGLGHIVRSSRIAKKLYDSGRFSPVLLTGCRALDNIAIGEGVLVEKITPIPLDLYASNRYEILEERVKQIKRFIKSYSPEIVVVDTIPLGYGKELRSILLEAIEDKWPSTFVLGSPYPPDGGFDLILKSPKDNLALSAFEYGMKYTDEEWEVELDELPFVLKNIGSIIGPPPPISEVNSNVILITGGGGAVSASLLEPLIEGTRVYREKGYHVRFVVGPLADFEAMKVVAEPYEDFELISALTVEEAVKDAKIVISRCGYNTALSLIRTDLPIIFVPYYKLETEEQFVRARHMTTYKNVQMVNPFEEHLGMKIEEAISIALESKREKRDVTFSINGTEEAALYLTEIANQMNEDIIENNNIIKNLL